jgi:hypothetical protein
MNGRRHRFKQISMLSGSRYIEITAQFVRRFTGLADRMRIYTDAAAFDQGLYDSVRLAQVAVVPGGGLDDATAG